MIYKTLAEMDFSTILFEGVPQTQSGKQLLEKYQGYTMTHDTTCTVVNNFLREARNLTYDRGVNTIFEKVSDVVAKNKYGWAIASTCESILNDGRSYNYLARNAAHQAEKLLEMSEQDIVQYVKAGALKNIQHIPQFRSISKSIYADHPVVETYSNYKITHPISIVEKNDSNVFFTVLGKTYKVNENGISEAQSNETSTDFKNIANFLQQGNVYVTEEKIVYNAGNFTYTITEKGKCVKNINGKNIELTTEQLREQNNLYISNTAPMARQRLQYEMEMVARLTECFDSIAMLDNTYIVESDSDRFLLIEHNDTAFATLLNSRHAAAWNINENIYNAVEFIKSKTKCDMSEMFKTKIDNVIGRMEHEKQNEITESLRNEEILTRKKRIETLVEKYKNDPAALAVLSKAAAELNEVE